MSIKNKKFNILPKSAMIAILSSFIYIGANNQEAYALPNESGMTQSYTMSNVEKGKVKLCDYLNIRRGPNTNCSIVTKIYTKDLVNVLEKNSNGWYKIKVSNGTIGWVNGKYIETQNNNRISDKSKKVVELAYKQLGKPYVWGAAGPNSFDCSGLTSYVYKNGAGVKIPRTSRDQGTVGKTVSKSNLKPGDLIFFSTTRKGISHVGLYIGNSKMIHAPKPGDKVRIDNINASYYLKTYVTSKTIL